MFGFTKKYFNYNPEQKLVDMINHSQSRYHHSFSIAIAFMSIIDAHTDALIFRMKELNCTFVAKEVRKLYFMYAMVLLHSYLDNTIIVDGDTNHTFEYVIRMYVNSNLKKWRPKDEEKKNIISDEIMNAVSKYQGDEGETVLWLDVFKKMFAYNYDSNSLYLKTKFASLDDSFFEYYMSLAKMGRIIDISDEKDETNL